MTSTGMQMKQQQMASSVASTNHNNATTGTNLYAAYSSPQFTANPSSVSTTPTLISPTEYQNYVSSATLVRSQRLEKLIVLLVALELLLALSPFTNQVLQFVSSKFNFCKFNSFSYFSRILPSVRSKNTINSSIHFRISVEFYQL